MKNKDLRDAFRIADVRQWQVAAELGIADSTFTKHLRQELPAEKKELVRAAIQRVVVASGVPG